MTTDSRMNEPTPEQVEAAAKVLADYEWVAWAVVPDHIKVMYRAQARAALVAAQEAAPVPPPSGLGEDALAEVIAERDAAVAAVGRVRELADQWNGTPDYMPSDYDKGRVDQRHAMTESLLAALDGAPEPKREYRARLVMEGGLPNHFLSKSRPFTADEMANPSLLDDFGNNLADGGRLIDQESRFPASPWLPVEGESK